MRRTVDGIFGKESDELLGVDLYGSFWKALEVRYQARTSFFLVNLHGSTIAANSQVIAFIAVDLHPESRYRRL